LVEVASIRTNTSVATRPSTIPVLANWGPSGAERSKCFQTLAAEWTTNQTPALTPRGLRNLAIAHSLPSCENLPKRRKFDGRTVSTSRTEPT
jgi:hypothetical protein